MDALSDRALPPNRERELRQALLSVYPPGFETRPGGEEVLETEIHVRPYWFRKRYIPWICSQIDLRGARVLEVGAGTGTSAVPLAERGALVESVDIADASLEVARVRAQLHGLLDRTNFVCGNAADLAAVVSGRSYDVVAYFASLEHMTYAERISTLGSAWSLLRPGGLLVSVDTPNRLWYYDNHTSMTNFFHWLPPEVAIGYARHTSRAGFQSEFDDPDDPTAPLRMARWGRGVSFHDFEIAIGPITNLETSGEWQFRRQLDPGWAEWWSDTDAGRYHALLRAIAPKISIHWLEEEIAVSLRRPPAAPEAGSLNSK